MWIAAGVFLAIAVIVSLGYYRWTRRKVIAMLAKMNGPPSLPLLGHTHMINVFGSGDNMFNTLLRYGELYSSPIAVSMGPLAHIFIYSPEQIQLILNSPHCLGKPVQYSFFWLDRGIFAAPADLWKIQRKLFTPSFGPGLLGSFVPIFNEKSEIMVEMLAKNVGKPQRDYSPEIVLCAMDTICKTAFGVDADLQRSPIGATYVEAQEKYVEGATNRFFRPLHYLDFIYRMTNACKAFKKDYSQYMSQLLKVTGMDRIENKLATAPAAYHHYDDDEGTKKPKMYFEKLMEEIQKQDNIKREDLDDNVLTMYFAGNETTATTLGSILLMIAMHPDVQDRVYQEIMLVCPDNGQHVTMEDAAKLSYTEMVCKETMRHFPIGPVIGRVPAQDVKLNDDITLPAGSTLICCIYNVHMDRKIWGPDYKKFNPDNFLPDLVAARHPYSFLPFSGGPRNCLGVRYAWLSMKILLVHVLRRYRLRTTLTMDTITVKFRTLIKIMDGCAISLEER